MNKKHVVNYLILILSVTALFTLVGCVAPEQQTIPDGGSGQSNIDTNVLSDDGVTFLSSSEAKLVLRQAQSNALNEVAKLGDVSNTLARSGAGINVEFDSAETVQSISGEVPSGDFSTTNVQYQNVDEADIVKTDGTYVYVLSGNVLTILEKADDKINVLGTIEVSETAYTQAQMYLVEDRLLVVATEQSNEYIYPLYSIYPVRSWEQVTRIISLDVSNKQSPNIIETATMSGTPTSSRIINKQLHVLTTQNQWYGGDIIMPWVRTTELIEPRIGIIGRPTGQEIFSTMAKFDTTSLALEDSLSFASSYNTQLTMNSQSILITFANSWGGFWGFNMWGSNDYFIEQKKRFEQTVYPHLPSELKANIEQVISQADSYEEIETAWIQVSDLLEEAFPNPEDDKLLEIVEKIKEEQVKYDVQQQYERQKTNIIRLDVNDYSDMKEGSVRGLLLNQFSIDEYDDHIRVATTVSIWANGRETNNNIYILDEELQPVSQIERIAPDEQIFSVRFDGDVAYMVTFEQIDPFFVIDLDPENPKILGEVKLPGFSNYLHPIGDDKVLGVGQERINDEQGISRQVVKLSLFDVSDRTKPTVVSEEYVDKAYSWSPAQQTHKAFTYDAQRSILYLPISWNEYRSYTEPQETWTGVYAWTIGDEIELLQTFAHETEERIDYWSADAVRRALYFGEDVLAVASSSVTLFDENAKVLDTAKLETASENYYYYE